jgi:hypothetical protein
MAQWIIGYVVGAYGGAPGLGVAIELNVPGQIRRIVAGFYLDRPGGVTGPPVPLTPVVTANAANEVQVTNQATYAGKRSVRIYTAAALANPTIYLFVETELGVGEKVGTPQAIPA